MREELESIRRDIYQRVEINKRHVVKNRGELIKAFDKIEYLGEEVASLERAQAKVATRGGDVVKNRETHSRTHEATSSDDSSDGFSGLKNVVEADEVEAVTPVEKLVDIFNPATRDRLKKDAFEAEYKPIRLSVANAMERQINPDTDPIFETDGSGTYWLVEIDDKQLLLPFPTAIVKDRHRESGALDKAFNCSGYETGYRYKVDHLIEPATLEKDRSGKQWKLKSAGYMKLTPYS